MGLDGKVLALRKKPNDPKKKKKFDESVDTYIF